jgi:hypothetical protein
MTLRRLSVALTLVGGLCVWGFALSSAEPAPSSDPIPVEDGVGGNRDEAVARYRANQSTHWRHVAVGNYSSDR